MKPWSQAKSFGFLDNKRILRARISGVLVQDQLLSGGGRQLAANPPAVIHSFVLIIRSHRYLLLLFLLASCDSSFQPLGAEPDSSSEDSTIVVTDPDPVALNPCFVQPDSIAFDAFPIRLGSVWEYDYSGISRGGNTTRHESGTLTWTVIDVDCYSYAGVYTVEERSVGSGYTFIYPDSIPFESDQTRTLELREEPDNLFFIPYGSVPVSRYHEVDSDSIVVGIGQLQSPPSGGNCDVGSAWVQLATDVGIKRLAGGCSRTSTSTSFEMTLKSLTKGKSG